MAHNSGSQSPQSLMSGIPYELEGSLWTTSHSQLQRKSSFFPLTPPQSSPSNANATHSYADSWTDSHSYTPIFSVAPSDTLTPASTPPRSHTTPQPNTPLFQGHISSFYPRSGYPSYYATNSTHPLTESLNSHLLRVITLLECGQLEDALFEADSALAQASASATNLPDMVSKCNLYRGACLVELKRWKDARRALVRAATVRGWNERVQALARKVDCEEREERKGEILKWEEARERRLSWFVALGW